MTYPRKAKPHAGGRGVSQTAPTHALRSGFETRPELARMLCRAWLATSDARKQLAAYAREIDEPFLGLVEAADALDLADQLLGDHLDCRWRL